MGVIRLTGRKRLGQFFTPISEAEILATWVVRSAQDRILEPSVGDGALLLPALAYARTLDRKSTPSALACDVDRRVITALRNKVDHSVELQQCDFFDLRPADTKSVDVVLANPPFTRNHQIARTKRVALRKKYPLKGAAGLWAYFILHARKFLRPGGRMAIVVPGAATFTAYGADLMNQLRPEFSTLALLELPTKPIWIGSADERGVLLLAEGYQMGAAPQIRRGVWLQNGNGKTTQRIGVTPSFEKLRIASRPLSSIANLSIGLVTGCNAVFLMNSDEVKTFGIRKTDLSPVVSRAKHAFGARITQADLADLANHGQKTLLLSPTALGVRNSPIRKRLAMISIDTRKKTAWLNKRTPWWTVDRGASCDAVFTYMNDFGPRIALTDPGIYCTNTLHKLVFKAGVDERDKYAAVLSLLSTFGQLFAEGLGRGYGGGVLKFELREARAFPILPTSPKTTERRLAEVDTALRQGDSTRARALADEALLEPVLGSSWRTAVQEMDLILKSTRSSRRRGDARLFSLEPP